MQLTNDQFALIKQQFATLKERSAFYAAKFEGIDLSSLDRMPESTVLAVGSLLPLIPLLGLGLSYLISCRIMEQKEF